MDEDAEGDRQQHSIGRIGRSVSERETA